jgi:hypothetical protein
MQGGIDSISDLVGENFAGPLSFLTATGPVGDFVFGGTIQESEMFDVPAAPEPSTWTMLLLGFAGLGFMAHRRKLKSHINGLLINGTVGACLCMALFRPGAMSDFVP